MAASTSAKQKLDGLLKDGFCLLEGVLDAPMLERMRALTDGCLDRMSEDDRKAQKSTGSMINVMKDPAFAELIAWPRMTKAHRSQFRFAESH